MDTPLKRFVRGYIEAALWSSDDDNGEPLERSEAVLGIEAIQDIEADCKRFMTENMAALKGSLPYRPMDYLGHDFWLTRNGHGTGFWDRKEIPQGHRDALTKASEGFGEAYLYIGDDGYIHHA